MLYIILMWKNVITLFQLIDEDVQDYNILIKKKLIPNVIWNVLLYVVYKYQSSFVNKSFKSKFSQS